MSITSVMAILVLLAGVPFGLYVTVRLWRIYRESLNPVTRERTLVASVVVLHALVYGLVFLNNDMPSLGLGPPVINFESTKIFTRSMELLLIIGASAYWASLYRKG